MGVVIRWFLIVVAALSLKKRRKEIANILICSLAIYLIGYFVEGLLELNFLTKEQSFYIYIAKIIIQLLLMVVIVCFLAKIFKESAKDADSSSLNSKRDMTLSLVGKKERLVKKYREIDKFKTARTVDEAPRENSKIIADAVLESNNALTTKKERILNKYRYKNKGESNE